MAGAATAQTQGVTDSEIVLGTTVDLTGPVAAIGVPMRAGFEVAAAMINDAGGINGRQLRIIVEDNGYDTRRAIQAVQKLINSDEVFAVIAPLGSAITLAIQPMVHDAGLPLLFPGAPTPVVYDPPHELSFAMLTGYDMQLAAATRYAHDTLGLSRMCVLYQEDESGEQSLHGVELALAEYGLEVTERASYRRGATDFSAQIARLRAADCDSLMLGTIVRETAGAAIEARRNGWDVPIFVPASAVSNAVIALGGEAVEGVYGFTSFLPISIHAESDPVASAALAAYRQMNGTDRLPDDYFFVAYSAVHVFAEAARNAGADLSVESLVAALEQISELPAPGFPPQTYTPEQRLGSSEIRIVQVQNGQWVRIDAAQ